MKTFGGIFDQIVSIENLHCALRKAARGKHARTSVSAFLAQAEANIKELSEEIANGDYRPRPFRQFRILDPKPRLISCADFRDRVVHHAICNHLAPLIDRRLIYHNYACRKGKGSHRAVLVAQQNARKHGYWLRTDIRHYYENIGHDILLKQLTRMFREDRLLHLLEIVVRRSPQGGQPGKGLPIGSLTSQWLANLHLNEIDHWLIRHRSVNAYIRYMDDFALWSDSKEKLHEAAIDLSDRLAGGLGLCLKDQCTIVAPTSEGMPFLGYRIFPGMIREKRQRLRRRRRLYRQRERQCEAGIIDMTTLQESVRAMDGPRRFFGFGEPLCKDNIEGRWSRGSNRVNRGGSWRNDDASNFRGANRNRNDPDNRNDNMGFRLVSTTQGQDHKSSNPPYPVFRDNGTETAASGAASNSVSTEPPLHRELFLKGETFNEHNL